MAGKKKEAKEKALEKMTAKELRELALKHPEIVGVHGMNKAELISQIKKAKGIKEDITKSQKTSARDIKQKIRKFRAAYDEACESENNKMAEIYKKRIARLKKKSRRIVA
jgi:ABC-type hemin transport system substrate-binding protein